MRLGAEGGGVACLDVNDDGAAETTARIEADGGAAVAVHCDVSDPRQVTAAVASVVSRFGPPDVLCNVAGVGRFYHSAEMTLDQWKRIIDINLTGTWRPVRPHRIR